MPQSTPSFHDFGLLPSLLKTLDGKRLVVPTEIQKATIPSLMERKSVVGISETGSGKTLSYALPLLHRLKTLEIEGNTVTEPGTPRAVVVVPSRELGEQISKVFKTLTHDTRLRVRPALGGMALDHAKRNVAGVFEILLATPGRLVQLMDLDLVKMNDVRMLIFDEVDQMLDEGFLPDSNKIVAACPSILQLGLFSATVSKEVQALIDGLFSNAKVAKSAGAGQVVPTLVTHNVQVENGKRWARLEKILFQPLKGGTLLFANTREQCDRLAKEMNAKGFPCGVYRGEMEPNVRRTTLKRFRNGEIKFLVCSDLGGRGLDIERVDRVINYHLPQTMENYLHRVGRTARAGRSGVVYNLVTERDEPLIAALEGRPARPMSRLISQERDRAKLTAAPAARASARPTASSARPTARAAAPSARAAARPSARPSTARPGAKRPTGRLTPRPGGAGKSARPSRRP